MVISKGKNCKEKGFSRYEKNSLMILIKYNKYIIKTFQFHFFFLNYIFIRLNLKNKIKSQLYFISLLF